MCARYKTPADTLKLEVKLGISNSVNYQANETVFPTDKGLLLTMHDGKPRFELARFGLIPHWAKTLKGLNSLHNARSETVKHKPFYKDAYEKRRCICIASGFFEWTTQNGKKTPYYFTRKDGENLYIASVMNRSTIDGEYISSFAMLTGEPTDFIRSYHDRMILMTEDVEAWLDPSNDPLPDFNPIPPDALKAEGIESKYSQTSNQGLLF